MVGASRKVGATVWPPPDLSVAWMWHGEEQLLVLSFRDEELAFPPEITEAERDVIRAVLRGDSNREIAARRRTSVRTVANQLRSIFGKLGIVSRAELAAWVGRRAAAESESDPDRGRR
jgi:DNA-binding NarL/FixJ family response regulator